MTCGNGGTYALGHEDTQTLCEFKPLTTINLKQFTKPGISPRPEKVERISAGLAHTGCIIDGRAYIWGKMGTNPNLIFRLPTLMAFRTDDYSHDIP